MPGALAVRADRRRQCFLAGGGRLQERARRQGQAAVPIMIDGGVRISTSSVRVSRASRAARPRRDSAVSSWSARSGAAVTSTRDRLGRGDSDVEAVCRRAPVDDSAMHAHGVRRGGTADRLAPTAKTLDIQYRDRDRSRVDVRGSGPLPTRMITALSRLAEQHRLARMTRHGELVLMRTPPRS